MMQPRYHEVAVQDIPCKSRRQDSNLHPDSCPGYWGVGLSLPQNPYRLSVRPFELHRHCFDIGVDPGTL